MPEFPRRFVHVDDARSEFGASVERMGELLAAGDPLADAASEALARLPKAEAEALVDAAIEHGISRVSAAPAELAALFAELERVPAWVDKEALEKGGELLFRAGWFGGLALGASLVYGFASPGGNKPLAFAGRLAQETVRRLLETSRFVEVTCAPNGLVRGAPGYAATVRVRLMHAKIRRMLHASDAWVTRDWGAPINQHDMGATSLLFSVVVIDSLAKMGFVFDEREVHLYMQLWRYSGYLMGVAPEVLPTSFLEGERLARLIGATEGPPDEDSRRLTRAFFASAETKQELSDADRRRRQRIVRLGQGVVRGVLGGELADLLDVPKHRYRHAVPVVREVVRRLELAEKRLPAIARAAIRRRAVAVGRAYWAAITNAATDPLTFVPPDELLGAPVAAALDSVLGQETHRHETLASVARGKARP